MFSKKIITCTLLLFVLGQALAQDYDDFFYGKLIDATTGEPIVFATVRVKGKSLGVISNNDGSFQVPIGFQLKGEDLEVSSMGYESKTISFSELEKNVLNTIYLRPSLFQLREATVEGKRKRRPTAKQIIRYALQQIPENYDQNPFELIGYYRDYQFKEDTYSNLNEALVKVADKGFKEMDYRKLGFGLFDYNTNFEFDTDSFAAKPYDYQKRDKFVPNATFGNTYAANELVLLFVHDAIRNHRIKSYSYIYRLVDDFIKNHRFLGVKMTNYGQESVYQIDFKKNAVPFQVSGSIYIDVSTFAIRKLDYAVYKQEYDDDSPNYYSSLKKNLLYEILVEYQDFDGQMYLNYISFHNQFKLVRPPKFYIKDVLLYPAKWEIKVNLNRPAANFPDKFSVRYKGKSLRLAGIYQVDAMTFGILFPINDPRQNELLEELFKKLKDDKTTSLQIEIEQLKDKEDNALGEREIEIIDQFREFFTQKVEADSLDFTNESFLVNKMRSLNHSSQPRIEQPLNEIFWMNTPLKTKP